MYINNIICKYAPIVTLIVIGCVERVEEGVDAGNVYIDTNPQCLASECDDTKVLEKEYKIETPTDLAKICGYVQVRSLVVECPECTGLRALSCLKKVTSRLSIGWSKSIRDLKGLENITVIGTPDIGKPDYYMYMHDVDISYNDNLEDISQMTSLVNIAHSMSIAYNKKLNAIRGFKTLKKVGGTLEIGIHDTLKNINAFPVLESIGGDLKIGGYYDEWVDNEIQWDRSLERVEGFDSLKSVGGKISIEYTWKLESIEGLRRVKEVGDIYINKPGILKNLEGLRGLEIAGEVALYETSLDDISALGNLRKARGLILYGAFTKMPDFKYLEVGDKGIDLEIHGMQLAELNGLERIGKLARLKLQYNPLLESLDGLRSLVEIGNLIVARNDLLKNLEGLANVKTITEMEISRNPSLPTCEAQKLVDGNIVEPESAVICENLEDECGVEACSVK